MTKTKPYPWEQQEESLVLETPEQTRIEYRLATFGARVVAALIDRVIIVGGIACLFLLALVVSGGLGSLGE